jgi:uncharacterized membrane protein
LNGKKNLTNNKKAIAKTITWRITGTLTTFTVGWIVSGSITIGIGIASIEFWAKLVLYYVHERLWDKKDESL